MVQQVLDKGYIDIKMFGDETTIVDAATVSTGKSVADGPRLIKALIQKEHWTPFEFVILQMEVKCPIFVARQWMRSRTWSFVERSRRYSSELPEFYCPFGLGVNLEDFTESYDACADAYEELLRLGYGKEIARCVLPVATYTTFVASVDLRNLTHFLKLRLDKAAQKEIRVYAKAILEFIKDNLPNVYLALVDLKYFGEIEPC